MVRRTGDRVGLVQPAQVDLGGEMGDVGVEIAHLLDDVVDHGLIDQHDLALLDAPGKAAAGAQVDQQVRLPAVDDVLGGGRRGDLAPAAEEEGAMMTVDQAGEVLAEGAAQAGVGGEELAQVAPLAAGGDEDEGMLH